MKDIISFATNNIKAGWKSTLVGLSLIILFSYQYTTSENTFALMSADTAVLITGVALLFAPDKITKPTDKPK